MIDLSSDSDSDFTASDKLFRSYTEDPPKDADEFFGRMNEALCGMQTDEMREFLRNLKTALKADSNNPMATNLLDLVTDHLVRRVFEGGEMNVAAN